jgi:hypothetical protein
VGRGGGLWGRRGSLRGGGWGVKEPFWWIFHGATGQRVSGLTEEDVTTEGLRGGAGMSPAAAPVRSPSGCCMQ